MNDNEMVRLISREIGNHYPPAHYKNEVKKRFKAEVSSATVTRSIGSYSNRLKANHPAIMTKANALLSECFYDHHLAVAMVKKAFLTS